MAPRRSSDPVKAAARKSRAQRRVGEGAVCVCGENRPAALIAGREPPTCYECDAKARGKSWMEWHHPAGKSNSSAVILVPANDHRAELSTDQYDWPQATLQNIDGSPVIAIAGGVRGFLGALRWLIDKFLMRIPETLEAYDAEQRALHGPQWWKGTALDGEAPKKPE